MMINIVCGVPGSGKSTYVAQSWRIDRRKPLKVCSADFFFYDMAGNYNFDMKLLGAAHQSCRDAFDKAVIEGIDDVCVDNTNVQAVHLFAYIDRAIELGYEGEFKIHILRVDPEKAFERNIHNVPLNQVVRMAVQLEDTIQFLKDKNSVWFKESIVGGAKFTQFTYRDRRVYVVMIDEIEPE